MREKQLLTKIENGEELQSLVLRPTGSTPLFDAIGTACTKLENQLNYSLQFEQGLQDYDFSSIRLSVIYRAKI